jgi:alpha-galactosidase
MFGVQPSVVAFDGAGGRFGLIAASEIPSALRTISEQGLMGYTAGLFEWVVGPGEEFSSEPVFYYGYSGPVTTTASSASTPLDRTLEGRYMDFLKDRIGLAAETAPMHGPQWMTWAYFYDKIEDKLVRELAAIAARCGFTEMLSDDGRQKGRLGTQAETSKFPDFAATAEFVRSQGMKLGLWVSCYRDRDSPDLADMPDGRTADHHSR